MGVMVTAAQAEAFALLAARGRDAIGRGELLSALAKLQARWVNQLGGRGTKTVQLTPAQEEAYLVQVRQLFDQLRHDRPELAATREQFAAFARAGLAMAFNPHQRRGPDGRWIKMGGRGSAGLPGPRLTRLARGEVKETPGTTPGAPSTYEFADASGTRAVVLQPDQAHEWAQALAGDTDAVLLGGSPRPRGGYYSRVEMRTGPGDDTPVYLDLWPNSGPSGPIEIQMTKAEARALADRMRENATYREQEPLSIPGQPRYAARVAALRTAVASGVQSEQELGMGMLGTVARVQHNNGDQSIRKEALGPTRALNDPTLSHTAADQNAAEELAGLVAAALGVRAPVVTPTSATESYIELMPGVPAVALYTAPDGQVQVPREIMDSPGARRMGVLDLLIDNGDRNLGNWLVDGGDVIAIDHGQAFAPRSSQETAVTSGPFVAPYLNKDRSFSKKNPLTARDIQTLRTQVDRLRPQFAKRGRSDWADQMSRRLDLLAAGASGTVDIFPQRGGLTASHHALATPAQTEAFARASLAMAYNPHQRRDSEGRWAGDIGGVVSAAADLTRANVDLTPEDRQFLSDYVEDGRSYREINDALRGNREMTPEMADKVDHLDSITTRAKLPGDTTLYRAMSVRSVDKIVGQIYGKETITDLGYGSASGDPDAVEDFKGTGPQTVVFRIKAKKGQPVLVLGDDLSDQAMMQTAQEVILPRGYKLKVDKVDGRRRDGVMVLTVDATYEGASEPEPLTAAFNPHQRRGPDGRWIRMPTSELKRPRRSGKGRARTRHVEVEHRDGRPVYKIGGRERSWSPAEARAVADALDATAGGRSVPPPVPGRVVSDGYQRRTIEQVQPFRNNKGGVTLSVGRDHGQEGSGEVELTDAQARALAKDLREAADRDEAGAKVPLAPADPPEYATQRPPVRLKDPATAYREARDEYNLSVYNVAWTHRQRNRDSRREDEYLNELMKEYDKARTAGGPAWIADEVADNLRIHLDSYYDGRDVLDPRPDEDSYAALPTLPPGPRTTGGTRPPTTGSYESRRTALDRSIRSGLDDQDVISEGIMGDTRRIKLADGTETIYKRAKAGWANRWTTEDQTDAEELASLVADAVGVRAPAIQRASNTELYMEVMPGTTAMAKGWRTPPDEIWRSDEGLKMGLLDVLLNNSDRHTGNWMVDDQGKIAAIDHGLAFRNSYAGNSSPFAARLLDINGNATGNPFSVNDIRRVRERLERLKPQFEAFGRERWYTDVLRRLNEVDAGAVGQKDIYPGAVTAAQRDLFVRAGALAYTPGRVR